MYRQVPYAELENRVQTLARRLQEADLDAMWISGLTHLYYFTGTIQNGILLVFADGRHLFLVRKSLARAREESGLACIEPLHSLKTVADRLEANGLPMPERIGFEADIVPVLLAQRYQQALPAADFVDSSVLLRGMRAVKSDFEIACIREAGRQVETVFQHLETVIRPGIREIDISAEAEWAARRAGHQGIIRMRAFNAELYYGVICAGDSANRPTSFDGPSGSLGLNPAAIHPAGEKTVEAGIPVLVDFMGASMGYLCDTTRVFVCGEPADELVRAHDACIAIQNHVADRLRPGVSPAELFREGRNMAESMGYGQNFMGFQTNQVRFLGHGVGLEVDEWPVLTDRFIAPLEVGMVIAVEPKIYLEELGGVGVENTFVVTPEGGVRMVDYSDELVVLPVDGENT